jgi:hypothetical protein
MVAGRLQKSPAGSVARMAEAPAWHETIARPFHLKYFFV